MPFTPFHFGPGLLIKGTTPERFSWGTFALAQVVIDCETLYNMVNHRYPLHRDLHTFVGATLAGIGTAVFVLGVRKNLKGERRWGRLMKSEMSTPAIWAGGIVGLVLIGIWTQRTSGRHT